VKAEAFPWPQTLKYRGNKKKSTALEIYLRVREFSK
jgi:hypothetical protein